MKYQKELEAALEAVKIASKIILEIYHSGTEFGVELKKDDSPVTIADKRADVAIRAFLAPLFPDYHFLTEEGVDNLDRLNADYVWIIDPLDGTKDFIHRDDEFTVNIALSYKQDIVVGVIMVPVTGDIYYAVAGEGAFLIKDGQTKQIHVNDKTNDLTISTSRYHKRQAELDYIEANKDIIARSITLGSTLKALAIADGRIEMFYRSSSGTKEWDVAASDLIVTEAGGVFIKPDRTKIKYNKNDINNRDGYLIVNREENIRL